MVMGCVLIIQAEVTLSHELEDLCCLSPLRHLQFCHSLLQLALSEDLETLGIQEVLEILVRSVGSGIIEEIVV